MIPIGAAVRTATGLLGKRVRNPPKTLRGYVAVTFDGDPQHAVMLPTRTLAYVARRYDVALDWKGRNLTASRKAE